jgi:large subunit ribosomal protein L6
VSRIGRMPIPIPEGVHVSVDGRAARVKGPKGELALEFDSRLSVQVKDLAVLVEREGDQAQVKALHGLTRALLANMVEGVSKGFRKSLEIVGLGYRADLEGNDLLLQIGHSHLDRVPAPEGIKFEVEKGNRIIHVDGADKELVGRMAAEIRGVRKPEPYRGKGIRYVGEHVRRKAGKAGKVALG